MRRATQWSHGVTVMFARVFFRDDGIYSFKGRSSNQKSMRGADGSFVLQRVHGIGVGDADGLVAYRQQGNGYGKRRGEHEYPG